MAFKNNFGEIGPISEILGFKINAKIPIKASNDDGGGSDDEDDDDDDDDDDVETAPKFGHNLFWLETKVNFRFTIPRWLLNRCVKL